MRSASPGHHGSAFVIDVARSWDANVDALARAGRSATPFQDATWLKTWYGSIGRRPDVSPLIVKVSRARGAEPVALFPLISRRERYLGIVSFADLHVTDYNAPLLLTPDGIAPAEGSALAQALIAGLAGEGDILRLAKMPADLRGTPNPCVNWAGAAEAENSGNVVRIAGSWEGYHRGLEKKVRKELERSLRVFIRDGVNARFVTAGSVAQAQDFLGQLSALQAARIKALGQYYVFDDPACDRLYRDLILAGHDRGYTVVTALVTGENELIAGLIGVCDGKSYAMLRLGRAGEQWSHCSPGRLIIDLTMQHLHAQGLREFDFTLGEYEYKKAFGCERIPLFGLDAPLSLRGRLVLEGGQLKRTVKQQLRSNERIYDRLKQAMAIGRQLSSKLTSWGAKPTGASRPQPDAGAPLSPPPPLEPFTASASPPPAKASSDERKR